METPNTESVRFPRMPEIKQRGVIYIVIASIILVIIIGIILFFANKRAEQLAFHNGKTATVFFTPYTLQGVPGYLHAVSILADTGGAKVSAVQLELSYDPNIVTSIQLSPPIGNSLFGTSGSVISNVVNQKAGRASYIIAASPKASTKPAGVGPVATMTFTLSPEAGGKTTEIKLLTGEHGTLVTKIGAQDSIVRSALPLKINIAILKSK